MLPFPSPMLFLFLYPPKHLCSSLKKNLWFQDNFFFLRQFSNTLSCGKWQKGKVKASLSKESEGPVWIKHFA